MSGFSFQDRANSLEDEFFYHVDEQLLANLRNDLQRKESMDALRETSGIQDEKLLGELLDIGVQAETLAAVVLIPLVLVAWADGKVSEAEKHKILEVEQEAGVTPDSASHELLQHWLERPPGEKLLTTWKHFISTLGVKLTGPAAKLLGEKIISRAREVAGSLGRQIGFGIDVGGLSPNEQHLIQELKKMVDENE